MTDLIVVPQAAHWQRLKRLVLDSVTSPITRRVYNLGLDEFFAWFSLEPRPGFTKATVSAWRVALEARGLGAVSINVRITAVRKLAVEAADNGLLAPELAQGISRVKSVKSTGIRVGNWLIGRTERVSQVRIRESQAAPSDERFGRFPSSDGMSTAQGIRADPFSESPTIRPEPRAV